MNRKESIKAVRQQVAISFGNCGHCQLFMVEQIENRHQCFQMFRS